MARANTPVSLGREYPRPAQPCGTETDSRAIAMSNSETQSLVNWAWSLVESGALTKSAFNRADAQCLADAHWLCGHGVDSSVIAQRMNTEPLSGSAGFKMERARIEEQIEETKE